MIRQWYEPLTFSEGLKRAFSFLNIAIFIITSVFIFSELRFDWVETLAGRYLSATNQSRPETGALWEMGKQTTHAHEYLNKIISKKENARQTVYQAASFSDLASSILPGEWVTLEKQQFKTLYLALEKPEALKIMEPAKLVWLINSSALDRIFCEGIADGINLYFIDSENRVIQEIDLRKEDLIEIENGQKPVIGRLAQIEEFSGRIYPAQKFFDAVFKLPSDILPDLMVNPETVLKLDGKIIHIGIWNEAENGYIKIGFEIQGPDEPRVVFIKGREWAVWQLSLILKGDKN